MATDKKISRLAPTPADISCKLTITRDGKTVRYSYPSPDKAMRYVEACLALGYVNETYVITDNTGAVVYQYPQ